MWLFFVVYLITFLVFSKILLKKRYKYKPFPFLTLTKNGIIFSSFSQHRIKINNANVLEMDKNIYLNYNGKRIVLQNVGKSFVKDNFLYFTALGNCKMCVNCEKFYNYFSLNITSNKFNLNSIKQKALQNILLNIFSINECVELKRYLHIIKNILKVNFSNGKLQICQNNYHLPFVIEYSKNGKKKRVKVNC